MNIERRNTGLGELELLDGSENYVPRRGLTPFKQGDLDGLCGLYAIINAFRWAMWPRQMETELTEALFAFLARMANSKRKLKKIVFEGAHASDLKRLLRHAIHFLRRKHDIAFEYRKLAAKRISLNTEKPKRGRILPTSLRGEAFILDIEQDGGHWTVFKEIKNSNVLVFDSAGRRQLPKDSFVLLGAIRITAKAR